jgi:hypothetical protein
LYAFPPTGYLEQGLLVKDPKKLRRNYLKSGYIYIDILSILPTDLAYFFLTTECYEMVPCPVIVRLNRVIKALNYLNYWHSSRLSNFCCVNFFAKYLQNRTFGRNIY